MATHNETHTPFFKSVLNLAMHNSLHRPKENAAGMFGCYCSTIFKCKVKSAGNMEETTQKARDVKMT
ncbi:hypothetical protein Syun_021570 [Stephania yunnanensis]|uniref:Uncharacterized protein n=1 Tax=Stephania yunnanensis TaxID=152371 RepID=A0AAP0NPV4_9MAGN